MEDPSSLLVDSTLWQISYSPLISEEPLNLIRSRQQGLTRRFTTSALSLNPPMGFPGGRSGVVWGWRAGWFRWCLGGLMMW